MGCSESQPEPPSPQTAEEFETEVIECHNTFRKLHGAPPLRNSTACRQVAQNWAETISETGHFEHNVSQPDFGESIFKGNSLTTGKELVTKWYNERSEFDYNAPTFSLRTGHFTQLVWLETDFIGVGRVIKGGTAYVVVNYDPPGNIIYEGQYEHNVLPRETENNN